MADAHGPLPNGVQVSHPVLGSLAISGRDLLLAVVLLALGCGAIAVQVVTMRAFQQGITSGLQEMAREFEISQQDRTEILHILRARSCAEALIAPTPRSDELRTRRRPAERER